jgi:hypothetical protein
MKIYGNGELSRMFALNENVRERGTKENVWELGAKENICTE